jgi:hypothetical protein
MESLAGVPDSLRRRWSTDNSMLHHVASILKVGRGCELQVTLCHYAEHQVKSCGCHVNHLYDDGNSEVGLCGTESVPAFVSSW